MANHAGIPNLVSEVSCALCSAGKSLPRSSVYTSFQQVKDQIERTDLDLADESRRERPDYWFTVGYSRSGPM